MSEVLFNELESAPSTPSSGKGKIYTKSKKFYSMDSDGVEHVLTQDKFGFNIIIGNGTAVISTGIQGYVIIPFDCILESVTLMGDVSGSVVVDLWVDSFANFPPTNADSITSVTPPTITSAQSSQDNQLLNWLSTITAGEVLVVNIDSVATIKTLTISITGRKT